MSVKMISFAASEKWRFFRGWGRNRRAETDPDGRSHVTSRSPSLGLDSTGNNENSSRMEAVNTTPSGSDQEVSGTVLVHVAHGHGIKAERISRGSAGEG